MEPPPPDQVGPAWCRPGKHVVIHGLVMASKLNGKTGVVCHGQATPGRAIVLAQGETASKSIRWIKLTPVSTGLPDWCVDGAFVVLQGLASTPELNGRQAIVQGGGTNTADHVRVLIDAETVVRSVSHANLVAVAVPQATFELVSTVGDAPKGAAASTVSHRGCVWSFGGRQIDESRPRAFMFTEAEQGVLHKYDVAARMWTRVKTKNPEDAPTPRSEQSGVLWGDELVIYGGIGDQSYTPHDPHVYALNLISLRWRKLGDEKKGRFCPNPRSQHAAVILPGTLPGTAVMVVVGGQCGSAPRTGNSAADQIFRFNLRKGKHKWKIVHCTLPCGKTELRNPALSVLDATSVYVSGGDLHFPSEGSAGGTAPLNHMLRIALSESTVSAEQLFKGRPVRLLSCRGEHTLASVPVAQDTNPQMTTDNPPTVAEGTATPGQRLIAFGGYSPVARKALNQIESDMSPYLNDLHVFDHGAGWLEVGCDGDVPHEGARYWIHTVNGETFVGGGYGDWRGNFPRALTDVYKLKFSGGTRRKADRLADLAEMLQSGEHIRVQQAAETACRLLDDHVDRSRLTWDDDNKPTDTEWQGWHAIWHGLVRALSLPQVSEGDKKMAILVARVLKDVTVMCDACDRCEPLVHSPPEHWTPFEALVRNFDSSVDAPFSFTCSACMHETLIGRSRKNKHCDECNRGVVGRGPLVHVIWALAVVSKHNLNVRSQPRTLSAMVWLVDHCRSPPYDKFLLYPAWRFLANAVLGAALPKTHPNGGQATHGDGVCDRELAKYLSGSTNVLEHALAYLTDSRRHASDEFCLALACTVRFTAGMLSYEPAGEKLAPSLTPFLWGHLLKQKKLVFEQVLLLFGGLWSTCGRDLAAKSKRARWPDKLFWTTTCPYTKEALRTVKEHSALSFPGYEYYMSPAELIKLIDSLQEALAPSSGNYGISQLSCAESVQREYSVPVICSTRLAMDSVRPNSMVMDVRRQWHRANFEMVSFLTGPDDKVWFRPNEDIGADEWEYLREMSHGNHAAIEAWKAADTRCDPPMTALSEHRANIMEAVRLSKYCAKARVLNFEAMFMRPGSDETKPKEFQFVASLSQNVDEWGFSPAVLLAAARDAVEAGHAAMTLVSGFEQHGGNLFSWVPGRWLVRATFYLGVVHHSLGDLAEAGKAFKKVLAFDSQDKLGARFRLLIITVDLYGFGSSEVRDLLKSKYGEDKTAERFVPSWLFTAALNSFVVDGDCKKSTSLLKHAMERNGFVPSLLLCWEVWLGESASLLVPLGSMLEASQYANDNLAYWELHDGALGWLERVFRKKAFLPARKTGTDSARANVTTESILFKGIRELNVAPHGESVKARVYLVQAAERTEPTDPLYIKCWHTLAVCSSQCGRLADAVAECTKVLNVQPKYRHARYTRGSCNVALKNFAAAKSDYEFVNAEIFPTDIAWEALQEIAQLTRRPADDPVSQAYEAQRKAFAEHIPSQGIQEIKDRLSDVMVSQADGQDSSTISRRKRCDHCHRTDCSLYICKQCKSVRYCSSDCQREAWPSHKPNCSRHLPTAAAAQAAAAPERSPLAQPGSNAEDATHATLGHVAFDH